MDKVMTKEGAFIYVNFNDELIEEDVPSTLYVYITSERNSYGIVTRVWLDGEKSEIKVDKGTQRLIALKAAKHNYLKSCSDETFYECVTRITVKNLKGTSSNCTTIPLPSFQFCKFNKTTEEEQEFENAIKDALDICYSKPKTCTSLEYFAEDLAPIDNIRWISDGYYNQNKISHIILSS